MKNRLEWQQIMSENFNVAITFTYYENGAPFLVH